MLTLAALKYRDVLAEFGGPIVRICTAPVSICGREATQANAYLAEGLRPGGLKFAVYGNADGTGTHESAQVARYMAISESLERWAYHSEHASARAELYGFKVDRSSNGMAAFPGWSHFEAHRRARFEALERFAVIGWWDGGFNATFVTSPVPDVHVLRVHHSAGFGEVAIVFKRSASGHACYGHAAAKDLPRAIERALVELARNETVLSYLKLQDEPVHVTEYFERRCLHFASDTGHQEFLNRVFAPPSKPEPRWEPVFDGEIPGPWSRYATVWRTAVKMPTMAFLDRSLNFFFW